ncbi:hypothetical protein [Nonlabens sp. Asnod2-A12]|uniref:hypothetical protein n=1 Tax=Nonlabens sp. Asnod2-A12 TaxID=3160578 RepID=UPI00386F293E
MKDKVNSFYDIKDLILELEKTFPVNEWEINGIHVWPKIRFKLYIRLCQHILKPGQKTSTKPFQKTVNENYSTKGIQWWKDFKELVLLNKQIRNNKLIFFGHSMHRIINNSLYFNRFFDSMIAHHNLQSNSITFDFDKLLLPVYNRKKTIDLTAAVRHYRRVQVLKNKIFKYRFEKSTPSLSLYNDFFEFCKNQAWFTKEMGLDLKSITNWTRKVSSDIPFYKKCFIKAKAQKIIFVSYYGFDSTAAAMVAANYLGIETVEFQHGPQSNLHMAYSFWTKVPNKGFNTMPLTYWVWDQYTARNFDLWIKSPNRAIVVNQPWLGYSLKETSLSISNDLTTPAKVLYTLQLLSLSPLEEIFPDSLLHAMKFGNYHFILRFHPRNSDDKEIYINFLNHSKVDSSKYSFQDPKIESLSIAMTKASIHITLWSGSLIEATLLNIPTIIFHKVGLMHYQNYLNDDLVHYVDPMSNEFILKLDLLLSRNNKINFNQPIYNPLT